MPQSLNEHGSEFSMTLDPTVDESARVDPFQEERECAIIRAAAEWLRRAPCEPDPTVAIFDAFRAGVDAAASLPVKPEPSVEDSALRWIGTHAMALMSGTLPVETSKAAFRAGVNAAPALLGIGPITYDLITCIKSNFEEAFPGETMRDPQDAIQRLAAQVMNYRRHISRCDTKLSQLKSWIRELHCISESDHYRESGTDSSTSTTRARSKPETA